MTYWSINAVFLGLVAVTAGAALLLRWLRGRAERASSADDSTAAGFTLVGAHAPLAPAVRAAGLATLVLLVMTAVFDNVMIGVGLVGYDETRISGAKLGVAPLEDFAYAVAALVLLPSTWTLLGGRRVPREPSTELPAARRAREASGRGEAR